MAKITDLTILNSGDKTRHFAVLSGKGAVADSDDPIVTNVKDFPIGSQYSDLTNKKQYVRFAAEKATTDWTCLNA